MTDIVERLLVCAKYDPDQAEAANEITHLRAEVERLRSAHTNLQHDIQQTLGRALGYPWFKNDQKNFPGSTEADGVCVGDHVAESLADEAADKIAALRAALSTARADALEEAAKLAEAKADEWATVWRNRFKVDNHMEGKSDGAGEIAAAIRKLIEL